MWLMLASLAAIMWGIPLLLSHFGLAFSTVMTITLPFMAILLLLGLRSLFIRCPGMRQVNFHKRLVWLADIDPLASQTLR